MLDKWTHPICDSCWMKRHPGKHPARLKLTRDETCCFCRYPTYSGIYVSLSPASPEVKCGGQHG